MQRFPCGGFREVVSVRRVQGNEFSQADSVKRVQAALVTQLIDQATG